MTAPREDSGLARASALWRPQPRLIHTIGNRDQLEVLNEGGGVAVAFDSLPKSPIHIAFGGSQSETLSIWTTSTRSGFRTRPKLSADLVALRFVSGGAMTRNGPGNREVVVGFNQALFTSFEEMRYEQASPGFAAITASVSRASLIDACHAMTGRGPAILPQFNQVVDLTTMGLLSLRRTLDLLHNQMFGTIAQADMMTPLLQELLVYQIISAWPTTGDPGHATMGGAADTAVKRAIDYIEANLQRRIGIAEIAAAAGLSVRALQTAFRRRLDCSPVQYLIARRLDRVHAALQSDTPGTIGQIAGQWGFTHMSDFGRRYRHRFGHAPRDLKTGF